MAITDPNTLRIGQTIRFKTMNPHDNFYWTGKIAAICDYESARLEEDVDTYYNEIRRSMAEPLPSKENLTYLKLRVTEYDSKVVTRVFAVEYIDVGTLELVEVNTYRLLRVYDINDSKLQDVVSTIQSLGYVVDALPVNTVVS